MRKQREVLYVARAQHLWRLCKYLSAVDWTSLKKKKKERKRSLRKALRFWHRDKQSGETVWMRDKHRFIVLYNSKVWVKLACVDLALHGKETEKNWVRLGALRDRQSGNYVSTLQGRKIESCVGFFCSVKVDEIKIDQWRWGNSTRFLYVWKSPWTVRVSSPGGSSGTTLIESEWRTIVQAVCFQLYLAQSLCFNFFFQMGFQFSDIWNKVYGPIRFERLLRFVLRHKMCGKKH